MLKEIKLTSYFSKNEFLLWCSSTILIVISFCVFDRENYLTLVTSLIGVTSLIFNSKGNPFGQLLDDFVQFIIWYYIVYLCLLWRNDYIFGHDNANGCFCTYFLA